MTARLRDAGYRVLLVDGRAVTDKASALAAVRADAGFPDWVGSNLDALADALGKAIPTVNDILSQNLARATIRSLIEGLYVPRDRVNDARAGGEQCEFAPRIPPAEEGDAAKVAACQILSDSDRAAFDQPEPVGFLSALVDHPARLEPAWHPVLLELLLHLWRQRREQWRRREGPLPQL